MSYTPEEMKKVQDIIEEMIKRLREAEKNYTASYTEATPFSEDKIEQMQRQSREILDAHHEASTKQLELYNMEAFNAFEVYASALIANNSQEEIDAAKAIFDSKSKVASDYLKESHNEGNRLAEQHYDEINSLYPSNNQNKTNTPITLESPSDTLSTNQTLSGSKEDSNNLNAGKINQENIQDNQAEPIKPGL